MCFEFYYLDTITEIANTCGGRVPACKSIDLSHLNLLVLLGARPGGHVAEFLCFASNSIFDAFVHPPHLSVHFLHQMYHNDHCWF
jgi:hypothetical protein